MSNIKVNVGDVVRVTRNDGGIYDCFVVEDLKRHEMFCGRILRDVKGKIPSTSWVRYGLHHNAICQIKNECKSVQVLSKGQQIPITDIKHAEVYQNHHPESGETITLCLSEDLGSRYGGWSDSSDESSAILESYTHSRSHLQINRLIESVS